MGSMSDNKESGDDNGGGASCLWFRHGLRLHDNPALLEALDGAAELYCIFIFDGEVAGTADAGFNRMRFLHQSLQDLDEQLQQRGGRLYVFEGQPCDVFEKIFSEWGIRRLCFEQDPEPPWHARDNAVKKFCDKKGVKWVEKISHTLYDPDVVLEANEGMPPHTFKLFNLLLEGLGQPARPVEDAVWDGVTLPVVNGFDKRFRLKSLNEMGIEPEFEGQKNPVNKWIGGERKALRLLESRLLVEKNAYESGYVMPTQYSPDLCGPPLSLSPHLRFGCLSVRKFFWEIHDLYVEIVKKEPDNALNAQLKWREFFYVMCRNNPNYHLMENNPVCLQIPWYENEDHLKKWTMGETGYPWIDACMNQMRLEGWMHHTGRHAVSCFLTRGDLWLNWDVGVKVFFKYMLDADWSVCSGNWMWLSSSAFENCMQCPRCFSPVLYGMRMDPTGQYIRRYVPALKNMPLKFLFTPWKAPRSVQEKAGCVVGRDYPNRMVEHGKANRECTRMMEEVKSKLKDANTIFHCAPSDTEEARAWCWLPSSSSLGPICSADTLCDSLETL